MADELLNLRSEFPESEEHTWRAAVEKALKGRPAESLDSKTLDDVVRKALYRETDWPSASDPDGVPGSAPFIRGAFTTRDAFLPWDIRQTFTHPDPMVTNAEILADLQNGVSSIEVRIDASGERGTRIRTFRDIDTLLSGVFTDLAGVALFGVADDSFGLEAAALLIAWAEEKRLDPGTQGFHFNVDPYGELARSGNLTEPVGVALGRAAEFSVAISADYSQSKTLRADARPVHEAGGSEAQELAYLVAAGTSYLRALIDAGQTVEAANGQILFTLATGPDYTLEIAKLRAARRLWSRVIEAFDSAASGPMALQAVTSRRMLSVRDPWVNLLRNTAACFAAGVGGADIVTVRPFTEALGLPDALARRMARNTQVIAQEESHLGKVADPAGGAWAVSRLADDLAQKAWSLFQDIDAMGGLGPALEADLIQRQVSETRRARQQDIASRKRPITGVSEFPLLDETLPETVTANLAEIRQTYPDVSGSAPASKSWTDTLSAARNGASLADLTPAMENDGAIASPLWLHRLAEPFERLRDHADAYRDRTGEAPVVFLATLGTLADHNARAGFATNFFASGGIEALRPETAPLTVEALADAFKRSGALLACICGSDSGYGAEATELAKALKLAHPDARIYLAGRPGSNEDAWREAGVDEFIALGTNLVASLELAHAELGVSHAM